MICIHRFVTAVADQGELRPTQPQGGEASAIRALIDTVKNEEVRHPLKCPCPAIQFAHLQVKVHVPLHDRVQAITFAGTHVLNTVLFTMCSSLIFRFPS